MAVVKDRCADGTDGKLENLIGLEVARVRGTISAAGVTPLSQGTQEVPPEAVKHVLVLAVFTLVTSMPTLQFVTKDEFDKNVQRAEDWIEAVANGRAVTYPDEPSDKTVDQRELIRGGSEDLIDTTAA